MLSLLLYILLHDHNAKSTLALFAGLCLIHHLLRYAVEKHEHCGPTVCDDMFPHLKANMLEPNDNTSNVLQGAMTLGRIPREATLRLSVELSTALTSETTASTVYRDSADAANGATELAGTAARAVTEQYHSALRLQNMTGQVQLAATFLTCMNCRLPFSCVKKYSSRHQNEIDY